MITTCLETKITCVCHFTNVHFSFPLNMSLLSNVPASHHGNAERGSSLWSSPFTRRQQQQPEPTNGGNTQTMLEAALDAIPPTPPMMGSPTRGMSPVRGPADTGSAIRPRPRDASPVRGNSDRTMEPSNQTPLDLFQQMHIKNTAG